MLLVTMIFMSKAAPEPPAQKREVVYFDVYFEDRVVPSGYVQFGEITLLSASLLTRGDRQDPKEPKKSLELVRQKAMRWKPDADAFMIGESELFHVYEKTGGPPSSIVYRVFPVVAYKRRGEEKDRDDGDFDGGGGG